jgi:hypothetical protein
MATASLHGAASVADLTDERELLAHLRLMNMRDLCADTQSLSVNDILHKMSQVKERHAVAVAEAKKERQLKSANGSPTGRPRSPQRSMSPATRSHSPQFSPLDSHSWLKSRSSPSPLHKQDFSIARFRPKTPIWEQCLHPDPAIEKELYRTPCFDCTGKNMASVGREEAKGCVVWVPPEVDRSIPTVSVDACSPTFRKQLAGRVSRAADIVNDQYALMPSRTERERNLKAKAGADLYNLQMVRDKVLEEKSSAGRSHSKSPQRR